jgi:F-type H+-transporting ATPase subunit b
MVLLTESDSMSRLFNLDWQQLSDSTLSIIAILVLFFFMSYFLFNPVRKLLNDRKNRIQEELETAKNDMEQASTMRLTYEERLKQADKEAEGILSDARKRGAANEAQIVAKAQEEAARIIARAQSEALLEKERVKDEVKRETILVASLMAGKLVAASIDSEKQDQLVEETLQELGESTWLN